MHGHLERLEKALRLALHGASAELRDAALRDAIEAAEELRRAMPSRYPICECGRYAEEHGRAECTCAKYRPVRGAR